MILLSSGFFSGELLGLSCCCWPAILTLCARGEEPLKQDRPDCPFLEPGGVLGEPDEAVELLSLLCDVSKEDLIVLDARGFDSPTLTTFSVRILPEEP